MGVGYKRNDTTNNIATGNVINASDLDGEYDAIEAAFDETTGHDHGGGADNGAPITKVGPTQDVVVSTSAVTPKTDNTVDLGSATFEFKDLYIDGTANIDSLVADTADINGGTIDGVTIGGASAGAGTFTTATATTGNITTVNATTVDTTNLEVTTLKAKDGTAAGSIADSTGVVTLNSSVLTTTDINGGTVDGVTIGGASAGAGTFTNLTATGTVTIPNDAISGDKVEGGTINATTITTLTSTIGNITNVNATTLDTTNIEVTNIKAKDGTAAGSIANTTGVVTLNSAVLTAADVNGGTIDGATIGGTTAAAGKFTTLEATGVTTFAAGTVSAPSITTTGDTNTGIFFPAADTIAFAEGGAEAMRIDSSGNVGIGTTTPAVSGLEISRATGSATPTPVELRLSTTTNASDWSTTDPWGRLSFYNADASGVEKTHAAIGVTTTGAAGSRSSLGFYTVTSSNVLTEQMRIDSSGNVGIGTSTPTGRLEVAGVAVAGSASNGPIGSLVLRSREAVDYTRLSVGILRSSGAVYFGRSVEPSTTVVDGFNGGYTGTSGGGAWTIYDDGSTRYLGLPTGPTTKGSGVTLTERMRIDSSGNVGIGVTSPATLLNLAGGSVLGFNRSTGNSCAIAFAVDNATEFSIEARNTNLSGVVKTKIATITEGSNSRKAIAFFTNNVNDDVTAGTERMRIDSSGNVGIGTTIPASTLEVRGAATIDTEVVYATFSGGASSQPALRIGGNNTGGSIDDDANRYTFIRSDPISSSSRSLYFQTGTTTRMVIGGTTGNVGIGTTSPAFGPLHVNGSSDTYIHITNDTIGSLSTDGTSLLLDTAGDFYIRNRESTNTRFYTANTERMRITSAGEVYIAGTTDRGAYNLQCNGTGVWGAGAYVNGSDSRIKEDVAPIDSGLDVVEKLNPVTYRYKENWSKDQSVQTGFIAQELLTALEGQNYVDGIVQQGGSEGYYSVAYQNIIPILTKAIQELSAKNDALEARIAALEAK